MEGWKLRVYHKGTISLSTLSTLLEFKGAKHPSIKGVPLSYGLLHFFMPIHLCENIGIFIRNYKSTIPGSNKVVYGPFEQESEGKNSKF